MDVGGKSEVIYDHMLRPANVSPWIEVAVDLERTEQSMGRLSYHALPETYLGSFSKWCLKVAFWLDPNPKVPTDKHHFENFLSLYETGKW